MKVRSAALIAGAAVAGAAVIAHAGPAVTTWPRLRRGTFPGLSGEGRSTRVALTFDDGPDPLATPRFLQILAARRVTATFFLLGRMVRRAPDLARRIAGEGHEIGLHGNDHRCLLWRGPRATYEDLAYGAETIQRVIGADLRWYRPPYGVLTGAALVAARRLELEPVLWTASGRDRTARATPDSVLRTVLRGLGPGGTILLHDSDCIAFPGAWRSTIGALPRILDYCDSRQWTVGPLRDHPVSGRRVIPAAPPGGS